MRARSRCSCAGAPGRGAAWQAGIEQLGLFMTWLAHAGPGASGSGDPGMVLAGPGSAPARGARRINAVLTAVRGMVVHAVAAGEAAGHLVPLLYEIADDRDLPGRARAEDGQMSWRMRALHRACEVEKPVSRAADADIAAVVMACRSARDRLIVLLMARAGLRRGEVAGLRRSDVHLLADSRPLGCGTARAHVHVVRREDNPNGAWAKSRRQRVVPLDFLAVQAFDTYRFERMAVPAAAASDFVFVNLFRASRRRADAPGRDQRPGRCGVWAGRDRPGAAPASAQACFRLERGRCRGRHRRDRRPARPRLGVLVAGVCASGPGPAAGSSGEGSPARAPEPRCPGDRGRALSSSQRARAGWRAGRPGARRACCPACCGAGPGVPCRDRLGSCRHG